MFQVMTHRWSLRETDLWNYSLSLQEIDKMRVDGKFVDAEGNRPVGQYVSLIKVNACAHVYFVTRSCYTYSGGVMALSTVYYRLANLCRRNLCQ